ncbi:uncharacterized protein LOC106177490 [Lingula anatina]|uniref:Uncharacterized protein LOC106177490 n=1 Tax=Lingula anatina TaxID=7574 RepID=A0A1S3K0D1_LINAN|nr:uncharacterized protein LOC106177490 [Lingula anatina]|eukprot:XP_013415731.1 uncharacterized protein LOC106177490 [Lingula anatina]
MLRSRRESLNSRPTSSFMKMTTLSHQLCFVIICLIATFYSSQAANVPLPQGAVDLLTAVNLDMESSFGLPLGVDKADSGFCDSRGESRLPDRAYKLNNESQLSVTTNQVFPEVPEFYDANQFHHSLQNFFQ